MNRMSMEGELTSPIARRQLHDELLMRLREYIIEGALPDDTKIPEKELCDRFGVSRTPLREALKVLAFEGLVVLNHNRGAIVKTLSLDDLEEAFPIYARLEALAGELACGKLTQAEIGELRRWHDEMVASWRKGDVISALTANEQIHNGIQTGSRNGNLLQLLSYVTGRVRRARLTLSYPREALDAAMKDHEQMMAALERRDAQRFSGAIREHIENTFKVLKDAWRAQHLSSAAKRADRVRVGAVRPA
jgi:DNA-binding GntR family transcriptional regulator